MDFLFNDYSRVFPNLSSTILRVMIPIEIKVLPIYTSESTTLLLFYRPSTLNYEFQSLDLFKYAIPLIATQHKLVMPSLIFIFKFYEP